jgi:hypothetical protein
MITKIGQLDAAVFTNYSPAAHIVNNKIALAGGGEDYSAKSMISGFLTRITLPREKSAKDYKSTKEHNQVVDAIHAYGGLSLSLQSNSGSVIPLCQLHPALKTMYVISRKNQENHSTTVSIIKTSAFGSGSSPLTPKEICQNISDKYQTYQKKRFLSGQYSEYSYMINEWGGARGHFLTTLFSFHLSYMPSQCGGYILHGANAYSHGLKDELADVIANLAMNVAFLASVKSKRLLMATSPKETHAMQILTDMYNRGGDDDRAKFNTVQKWKNVNTGNTISLITIDFNSDREWCENLYKSVYPSKRQIAILDKETTIK